MKTLSLSVLTTLFAFSNAVNALDILDYQQNSPGNIAGVISIGGIQDKQGDLKVTVAGETEKFNFDYYFDHELDLLQIKLNSHELNSNANFSISVADDVSHEEKTYLAKARSAEPIEVVENHSAVNQPSLIEQPSLVELPFHKVKKGESITRIAVDYRKLGGSFHQRVSAFILLNKSAFENNDISFLIEKSKVVLPSTNQILALDEIQARRYFHKRLRNKQVADLKLPAFDKSSNAYADSSGHPGIFAVINQRLSLLENFQSMQLTINEEFSLRQRIYEEQIATSEKRTKKLSELLDKSQQLLTEARQLHQTSNLLTSTSQ